MKSFIETQFPVSKLSKECYKERKAGSGQTLTKLGKWWGRKPLILARASILGLLMPASDDPVKDREIFLKVLAMDNEGLWTRKNKSGVTKPKFAQLSYDDKMKYCDLAEKVSDLSDEVWADINVHLNTNVHCIEDLITELGIREYGHTPRVGDCFCGGGSIPFEAASLGCDAYGSDLNPAGMLLSWASVNLMGQSPETIEQLCATQQKIYDDVLKQVEEWGIEKNEHGQQADMYLYCMETTCPECGWKVPLAPSWIIGDQSKVVGHLIPDEINKQFDIQIISGATPEEIKTANDMATIKNSKMVCPNPKCAAHAMPIPITTLRINKMRKWEKKEIVPRAEDLFQERLYCIRWVNKDSRREFKAPDEADLKREQKVLDLLSERINEWQTKGYVPEGSITPGENTNQPIRDRGWTHWHHLFNPRQLLIHGLFNFHIFEDNLSTPEKCAGILGIWKCTDHNSKLTRWESARENGVNTFSNQALNPLYNYITKSTVTLHSNWLLKLESHNLNPNHQLIPLNATQVTTDNDLWITDPPYADAVNYHEISEYFLAWHNKKISNLVPGWYSDTKRALTIKGSTSYFIDGMVKIYTNLTKHMPDNGAQIVMFTHQDPEVWANLAIILWASGLQVTAAWCVATETDSAMKAGNYVKGTVLLVLRKQTSNEVVFLDDIGEQVEDEVRRQIDTMKQLDDKEDPNFKDKDYQLASYAAVLRVVTRYKAIEEINLPKELIRIKNGEKNGPVTELIRRAIEISCLYLIPPNISKPIWKSLNPVERFYFKGLDTEAKGEHQISSYQEFARGFGVNEYVKLMSSTKANQTRLRTASEFEKDIPKEHGFDTSLTRHILFAVRETVNEDNTTAGKLYLRTEVGSMYWDKKDTTVALLNYLASLSANSEMSKHWEADSYAAKLLAGAIENDHV